VVIKILVLDIETRPNLAYVWGLWDQNIGLNQIEEAGEMICWAAKWVGKTKVTYRSVYSDGKEDMVQDLWGMLNDADAVITYNGRRFDIPWANCEFMLAGMDPPAPYRQIDLYKAVRKQFKFPSYKLDYVCRALGIGAKVQHEGFELWKRCMANEASAWKTMRLYNVNDTVLTELLYERIKPWIPGIPSFAAHEQERVCPACGSKDLQSRGYAYTQQSKYRRYQCQECGKWSRDTKVEKDKDGKPQVIDIREVAD